MRRIVLSVIVSLVIGTTAPPQILACTLFAAAGERVEGGGVLVAKNRDWRPNQTHTLRHVSGRGGYSYYGLFAHGGEDPGLKAGINDQGLVVVSATAPFSRGERRAMPRTKGLMATLLSSSATVDEALRHRELFQGPRFLLIADRRTAAMIEIAPVAKYHVERAGNSVLYHTNHYLALALRQYNPKRISASSRERYRRIERLLVQAPPFNLEGFVQISEDRAGGPDRSIWRDGSNPMGTRTLAAWIVHLPTEGEPQIYVKTADPGAASIVHRLAYHDVRSAGTWYRGKDN